MCKNYAARCRQLQELLYKINRITLSTLSSEQYRVIRYIPIIRLDILPVIASGAGVHTEAIADMLTIFTQKMRHLVFFNSAKLASLYLFNFFSSTVLRNRKSPVYSCAKEIVVLFNRETVLECKHLKEALYSLFNIFNKYNLAPIVVITLHNNLYSKYTLHVTCGYPPHARLVSNYFFFYFFIFYKSKRPKKV